MLLSSALVVGIALATLTSAAPLGNGDSTLWAHVQSPPAALVFVPKEESRFEFKTYEIWAQTCRPRGKSGQVPLIVGIHGINFDHSYWEFGYSKDYNFIEAANKAGYAVLTYDRLGVGQSDKPDGLEVVQSSTEVEILHQIIKRSRESRQYSKVLGIGHSFGAIQLTGIAARYPTDLDAVILTGYTPSMASVGMSFTGWYRHWRKNNQIWLDSSYLGTGSPSADRFAFFADGFYDEADSYLGEFLTIAEPVSKPAPEYKGHVFVVTGEKDLIFCGGNCLQKPARASGDTLLDDTKTFYPNAASFSSYVPPGAGHALFAHHHTDETIDRIIAWIANLGM
ncbi:alpha beta-hydrolase [Rhizoctonia solani]|uniref:Alpha beta-hydrolase n=1 Tax=Rhizoctonia solani TaxID=456999 RepID=A0A8H7IG31_9AGAM|nr:alpha beta-hydrolase [Rhizoctonia solani]